MIEGLMCGQGQPTTRAGFNEGASDDRHGVEVRTPGPGERGEHLERGETVRCAPGDTGVADGSDQIEQRTHWSHRTAEFAAMSHPVEPGSTAAVDRIGSTATIGHTVLQIELLDPTEQILVGQISPLAQQLPHRFDRQDQAVDPIVELFLVDVVVSA